MAVENAISQAIADTRYLKLAGGTMTGNIAMTGAGTLDGRDVSADGAKLDTLYTTIGLSALTSVEVDQLENIGTVTISNAQWGYLGVLDQGLTQASNVKFAQVTTTSGRIVNTTRITSNTTLDATHHNVFCDTGGGSFTVTLSAGVDGTEYRIINTGTAAKDVTVTPDGAELLLAVNGSLTLGDGDVLVIVYEATEGWY